MRFFALFGLRSEEVVCHPIVQMQIFSFFWHDKIYMHSYFDNRCNLFSRPKTCVFSIIPKLNQLFVPRYVCVQHLMILFTSISYDSNVTQSHT